MNLWELKLLKMSKESYMNEQRKAWCKKYKVNIAEGGFIEKYCIPEHVECILPSRPNGELKFIGFDGRLKSYSQLTEEEKKDYEEQCRQIPGRLKEFVNNHHNQQER